MLKTIIGKSLVMVLVWICVATVSNAQIHGLSVVDLADSPLKGNFYFTGTTFTAETSSAYSGRISYGVNERLLVFTDLGVHDADYFDPEFLGQFGMRYTLPLDIPFDLALRSTTIPFISSYEHYVEFTLTFLASYYLGSGSKWAVYGSTGIGRQWWELEVPFDPDTAAMYGQDSYVDRGNRTDISVAVGVSRQLFRNNFLFLEFANVDENYFSMGIRLQL